MRSDVALEQALHMEATRKAEEAVKKAEESGPVATPQVVNTPTVPPPINICCRDDHKNIGIYGEAVLEYQGKWYCGLCAVNIE